MPRQASWAEPALPPAAAPEQASAVLLGFADGTQVALDERDPSALALRAVADALVEPRQSR